MTTIVMTNGQNINVDRNIYMSELPIDGGFMEVTDKDTNNQIVLNVNQISYVINRA